MNIIGMIVHIDIDMTLIDIAHFFEMAKGIRPSSPTYNWDARYYPGAIDDIVQWLDEGREERVIDGAFEAIDEMIAAGHDVLITTMRTPAAISKFKEKYPKFASIVRSKMDVIRSGGRFDVLIDDYPAKEHADLAARTIIVRRDYNDSIMPHAQRVASVAEAAQQLLSRPMAV